MLPLAVLPAGLVNHDSQPILGAELISTVVCITLLNLGELVFGAAWEATDFPPVDAASKAESPAKSLLQSRFADCTLDLTAGGSILWGMQRL